MTPTLRRPQRITTGLLVPLVMILSPACTPNDSEPTPSTTSGGSTLPASSSSANAPAPRSSSENAPPSRRTTGKDVALVDFSADRSLDDYEQAAVPVDAWPSEQVLSDASPEEVTKATQGFASQLTEDQVMVVGETSACLLLAVWALPHPDQVVVGWEPHPNLTCVRAVPYTLLFAVPREGINSEGSWSYGDEPAVKMLVCGGSS